MCDAYLLIGDQPFDCSLKKIDHAGDHCCKKTLDDGTRLRVSWTNDRKYIKATCSHDPLDVCKKCDIV